MINPRRTRNTHERALTLRARQRLHTGVRGESHEDVLIGWPFGRITTFKPRFTTYRSLYGYLFLSYHQPRSANPVPLSCCKARPFRSFVFLRVTFVLFVGSSCPFIETGLFHANLFPPSHYISSHRTPK